MGHTKPKLLSDLATEFEMIRALEGIKEKSPGIFYYKSTPFLHFHDKDGRRWAHLKVKKDWQELEIDFESSAKERKAFLATVKRVHRAFSSKS